MAAGFHHFIIEQGATFGRTLTLKDSSDSLVNLTGYSAAEMDLRYNSDDSAEILTLTVANSRITLGGAAGTVILTITASDTASMSVGDGVYDIKLTAGDGTVSRIMEGTFSVRGSVSR